MNTHMEGRGMTLELQLQPGVVRGFYGDDVSGEVWS